MKYPISSVAVIASIIIVHHGSAFRIVPSLLRSRMAVVNWNVSARRCNVMLLAVTNNNDGINTSSNTEEDSERIKHNSEITVSSSIDLPFSADIAFDAFRDPLRQPSWSQWIRSVEYIDQENMPDVTKWSIRVIGMKFSWNARHTNIDRTNGVIEWESASGLRNRGRVKFVRLTDNASQMHILMVITTPAVITRLLGGRRKALQRLIEDKMLSQTLQRFRDVVLEDDVPKYVKQQQKTTSNTLVGN